MGFLVRYRKILALVAVVLTVALMSYISRERDKISSPERGLTEFVKPIDAVLYRVFSVAAKTAGGVFNVGRLYEENQRLKKQLVEQQRLIGQLQEQVNENRRLREILELPLRREVKTVTCRVIGRSPDNWFKTLMLDKGEMAGISKDMCVMAPQGLVGRIVRTTATTSIAMLMSDPDSGVGALVMRSREAGVVVGGVGSSSKLDMRFFSQNPDVRVGDVIITSGLGRVFPKGIPIGYVMGVRDEEYGLIRVAEVRPLANLDSLEEVVVMLEKPAEIHGFGQQREEAGSALSARETPGFH